MRLRPICCTGQTDWPTRQPIYNFKLELIIEKVSTQQHFTSEMQPPCCTFRGVYICLHDILLCQAVEAAEGGGLIIVAGTEQME